MPARSRSEPPLPSEMAFVVQFAADMEAPEGRFMGRVEHVVSGRATQFASLTELLRWGSRDVDNALLLHHMLPAAGFGASVQDAQQAGCSTATKSFGDSAPLRGAS